MASQGSTIEGAQNAEEWREDERRIKTVAAKATSKYLLVCIYNNTAVLIPYTYRWEGYRDWRKIELQPYRGYRHWHAYQNYPLDRRFFYIRFDAADSEGIQLKSYTIEPDRTESSNMRNCPTTYVFQSISSHEIDLRRR
jgi:hypothetical protein